MIGLILFTVLKVSIKYIFIVTIYFFLSIIFFPCLFLRISWPLKTLKRGLIDLDTLKALIDDLDALEALVDDKDIGNDKI